MSYAQKPAQQKAVKQDAAPKSSSAQQEEALTGVELGAQWPAVFGKSGQNFNSQIGFNGKIYLGRFFDERLDHFIHVGFQMLQPVTQTDATFNLVPILAGLALRGNTGIEGLTTSFGIGVGGALGWINIPNAAANSFRVSGYFSAMAEPGIELAIAEGFAMVARMPVTFIIGQRQLGFVAFSGGLRYDF
jgi:hypothetical protein